MADVKNKTVNIYIDQTSALAALDSLQKKADKLTVSIDAGRAAGKNMNAEIKKLSETQAAIKNVQDQLDKGLAPTLRQQQSLVVKLNNELKLMSQNDPAFAAKAAEYQKQNLLLGEMKDKVNGVKEAGTGLTAVGVGIASFFASIAASLAQKAIGAVQNFFSGAIDEAEEAQRSTSRLHNSLDNLGRGDAFDRITAKSNELASTFKHLDNDNINEVFQQLITYGKLTENQMNQLLPVIIDFAAKSGISVNESASVIIKAFEGNSKALKEYGINIKDGKDVTERFGIVMSEIGPKVAGASEAFEKTSEGIKAISEQDIKNLQEEIGNKMLPLMEKWYKTLSVAIDGLKAIFTNTGDYLAYLYRQTVLVFGVLKDVASLKFSGASDRIKEYNDESNANKKLAEDIKARAEIQKSVDGAARDASKATIDQQKQMLAGELALKDAASKRLAQIRSTGTFSAKDEKNAAYDYVRARDSAQAIQSVITQSQDKRVLGSSQPDNDDADAKKKAAAEHESLLKEVEAFNKKLHDLNFLSEQATKTDDQKELDAIKEKYATIFEEYEKLGKKIKGSGLHLALSEEDLKSDLFDELNATIVKQGQKAFEEQQKQVKQNLAKAYQEQQQQSDKFYEEEKNKQAQRFVKGEIDKTVFEANIAHIDAEAKKGLSDVAEKFAAATVTIDGKEVIAVEQASKDLTKFKREELDKQTKDVIAAYQAQEAERILMDDLRQKGKTADINTKVIVAKASYDKQGEYDGQQEALEDQRQQELKALDKRKQDALKSVTETGTAKLAAELLINNDINQQIGEANAKFDAAQDELRKQHVIGLITIYLDMASQALGVFEKFAQARTNSENAALAKELKGNDVKKAAFKKQLDGRIITQEEYDRQVAALDAAGDAKKEALAKKQFERNKKLQLAQAIVSGAQAALKTLETFGPPIPPNFLGIGAMILTLATVAAEVSTISSAKYGKGGRLDGPSHSEGGMPVLDPVSGRKVAEVEGGEYILSKATVANNRGLADALLHASMNEGGRSITPSFGKGGVLPGVDDKEEIPSFGKGGELPDFEQKTKEKPKLKLFGKGGIFGREEDKVEKFAKGGTFNIKPFWEKRPYKSIDYPTVTNAMQVVKYASGGVFTPARSATGNGGGSDPALVNLLSQQQDVNQALGNAIPELANTVKNLNDQLANGIGATVSLKQLEDTQAQRDRIKKAASFK